MEVSGPTSRPSRYVPRERAPDNDWIRSWVGSRASVDMVTKIKIRNMSVKSKGKVVIVLNQVPRHKDVPYA
jgi:hypothetical protein